MVQSVLSLLASTCLGNLLLACGSHGAAIANPMDERIYMVMVESFVHGGNASAAPGYGDGYGKSHHRGNIQGITQAIPYIASLGMNALWISPVFDSEKGTPYGDHINVKLDATGYFTRDYFNIDPMFGTLKDYKTMVATAHTNKLKVIMDMAIGHNKNNVKLSPQGRRIADNRPNFANNENEAFLHELLEYWIETAGVDGYRLDQAYQVPTEVWFRVIEQVRAKYPDISFVGEILCSGEIINGDCGFWGNLVTKNIGEFTTGSSFAKPNTGIPRNFNFQLFFDLRDALGANPDGHLMHAPAHRLKERLQEDARHFTPGSLVLTVGNHDFVRHGNLLLRTGVVSSKQDQDYWRRHKLLASFTATYTGSIQTYYGLEIGDMVPGFVSRVDHNCVELGLCEDHAGRTSGQIDGFDAHQSDLTEYWRSMMKLRDDHPSFSLGDTLVCDIHDDAVLPMVKYHQDSKDAVLAVYNFANSAKHVDPKALCRVTLHGHTDLDLSTLESFQMEPLSTTFVVLTHGDRRLRPRPNSIE